MIWPSTLDILFEDILFEVSLILVAGIMGFSLGWRLKGNQAEIEKTRNIYIIVNDKRYKK